MQSGNLDIACAINVTLHQHQNGYPNNKEMYNTRVTVCVFTHILDAIYLYFSDSNWAVSCRANLMLQQNYIALVDLLVRGL